MDIRSLSYAVTLAEELHFGRAAERHFIAAQPFGRHIQRLEREVGASLFERTSRRVTLTPAGERLVARARVVLAEVDRLAEPARWDPPVSGAPFRLGVLGVGAAHRWGDLRETVVRQQPGLVIEHYELDLETQYDAIRSREVDAGITWYVGPIEGLRFEVFLSSPPVAVVPAGSSFADAESLTLAELAGRPALNVPVRYPSLADWLGPLGETDKAAPVIRLPAAIPSAVATTGRLSLHAAAAKIYYPHPDVRFIPLEGPAVQFAVAARDDDDRPDIAAFLRAAALVRSLP